MKKPPKRKMYQKRRKREKSEQRKKDADLMQTGKSASAFNKCSKKAQKNYENYHQRIHALSPITSYSQGLQLWWQTYCSAIEFHIQQQNAWQTGTQENHSMLLQKYANEYETSSEEEDEVHRCPDIYKATVKQNDEVREEYVDEDYIKFLQITLKHQEEMRIKRAKENV